jgi:hypothetical protein
VKYASPLFDKRVHTGQRWREATPPAGVISSTLTCRGRETGGVEDGYTSVKSHDDHCVDADEDGQEANYSVGLTQAV